MDSFNPESPAIVTPVKRAPRIWEFGGTALWGLFIFVAMFGGQIAVVAFIMMWQGGPFDVPTMIHVVSRGLTISLSVLMGLPAVVLALWIAIRPTRTSIADYLALRWTSWKNLLLGAAAVVALVGGWDLL